MVAVASAVVLFANPTEARGPHWETLPGARPGLPALAPPSSPSSSSPPLPSAPLTFRDINVLAVTDVHSWIGGHNREAVYTPQPLTGTFGHLVSFVTRAKAVAARTGKDVFLVDNGDVVDGTGLSNIAADHCTELLPLLQKVTSPSPTPSPSRPSPPSRPIGPWRRSVVRSRMPHGMARTFPEHAAVALDRLLSSRVRLMAGALRNSLKAPRGIALLWLWDAKPNALCSGRLCDMGWMV